MPIVPVRGVGSVGVISDVEPQDAPILAWTDSNNVRFSHGKVSRYSIPKHVLSTYQYSKVPTAIFEGGGLEGDGYLVTCFSDGTMEQLNGEVITDVTPTGTLGTSVHHFTQTQLGGVTYASRLVDVPVYRNTPSDGAFAPIPGWSVNDRCYALRSYKDFLVALHVVKSGVTYQAMVKWSDAAQFGAPPSNWDYLDDASLAGETVLNDATGPILDGKSLGRSFFIYGSEQVWRMDYVGGSFVFDFDEVFSDRGVISQNCVETQGSLHYVFGQEDIYMHDGVTPRSLVDGRNSERIFGEINREEAHRCFVYHDEYHKEIVFAYPSNGDDVVWRLEDTLGCNKAYVYNYRDGTGYFIDLPGVLDYALFSQVTAVTWATLDGWDQQDATWASFQGKRPSSVVLCSTGNGTKVARPYIMDDLAKGRVPNTHDPDLVWPAYAEKEFIDLDELGAQIYGNKQINGIYPQCFVTNPQDTISFDIGATPNVNFAITYSDTLTLSPWSDEKADTRVNGKYLALRFNIPQGVHANLSGYDLDVEQIAGR